MDYTNTTTKQVSFINPKNPEIDIGYALTVPTLGNFVRKLYTRESYVGDPFLTHGKDVNDIQAIGKNTYYFYTIGHQIDSANNLPSFLSKQEWGKYKLTPTGFLTAAKTVMPNLLVPSQKIIDNGIWGSPSGGVFNWEVDLKTSSTTTNDYQKSVCLHKGLGSGKIQAQLDPANICKDGITEIRDINIEALVGGGAFQIALSMYDSDLPSKETLLEGDAVYTSQEGARTETTGIESSPDSKIQPTVVFSMGSLQVSVDVTGKCVGVFTTGQKNSGTLNLIAGMGGEGIPQSNGSTRDEKQFIITVYPLWNGVGIQSGIQSSSKISELSAYIPVIKEASIMECAEMKARSDGLKLPFDPSDPNHVFIKTSFNGKSLLPDLGQKTSKLVLQASNCNCKIAFAPLYFTNVLEFDHVIVGNADINGFSYSYSDYPIWTNNGTGFTVSNKIALEKTTIEGPTEFSVLHRANFSGSSASQIRGRSIGVGAEDISLFDNPSELFYKNTGSFVNTYTPLIENTTTLQGTISLSSLKIAKAGLTGTGASSYVYSRNAGELFGSILEMQETLSAPSVPSPDNYHNNIIGWEDFITGVSITIGLDGTSGSLTFDKYGATNGNQELKIDQCVGKINVIANGSYNTNGNFSGDVDSSLLFAGYTWDATENLSTNGAECTINLIGVEKRLDDIPLVNPPIFDGYQFGEVVDYLCNAAGVAYDLSSADSSVRLQMSSDPIETVCFNWTTGTEIRQALDQVCKDTAHSYISIDGKLIFFQRNELGIPNYVGKFWSGFEGYNVQSLDLTPDFENLRNQILLMGMRKVPTEGQPNSPQETPLFPLTTLKKNVTYPVIPWMKGLCYTVPGFPNQKDLDTMADNLATGSAFYEMTGTTTIPGTNIKPLDIFMNNYIVLNVSHNIDLVSKSWTTTLGLQNRFN